MTTTLSFRASRAVVIGIDAYSGGIPALRTAVADAPAPAEARPGAAPGGNETVLIVDDNIEVREVMAVIEGQESEVTSNADSRSPMTQVLLSAWREVAQVEYDALRAITFADLVARIKRRTENMFYI